NKLLGENRETNTAQHKPDKLDNIIKQIVLPVQSQQISPPSQPNVKISMNEPISGLPPCKTGVAEKQSFYDIFNTVPTAVQIIDKKIPHNITLQDCVNKNDVNNAAHIITNTTETPDDSDTNTDEPDVYSYDDTTNIAIYSNKADSNDKQDKQDIRNIKYDDINKQPAKLESVDTNDDMTIGKEITQTQQASSNIAIIPTESIGLVDIIPTPLGITTGENIAIVDPAPIVAEKEEPEALTLAAAPQMVTYNDDNIDANIINDIQKMIAGGSKNIISIDVVKNVQGSPKMEYNALMKLKIFDIKKIAKERGVQLTTVIGKNKTKGELCNDITNKIVK
ncbi:MAG: hypothetical protein Faunusvirus59_1, partial [Faunusvirus sp.]